MGYFSNGLWWYVLSRLVVRGGALESVWRTSAAQRSTSQLRRLLLRCCCGWGAAAARGACSVRPHTCWWTPAAAPQWAPCRVPPPPEAQHQAPPPWRTPPCQCACACGKRRTQEEIRWGAGRARVYGGSQRPTEPAMLPPPPCCPGRHASCRGGASHRRRPTTLPARRRRTHLLSLTRCRVTLSPRPQHLACATKWSSKNCCVWCHCRQHTQRCRQTACSAPPSPASMSPCRCARDDLLMVTQLGCSSASLSWAAGLQGCWRRHPPTHQGALGLRVWAAAVVDAAAGGAGEEVWHHMQQVHMVLPTLQHILNYVVEGHQAVLHRWGAGGEHAGAAPGRSSGQTPYVGSQRTAAALLGGGGCAVGGGVVGCQQTTAAPLQAAAAAAGGGKVAQGRTWRTSDPSTATTTARLVCCCSVAAVPPLGVLSTCRRVARLAGVADRCCCCTSCCIQGL